MKPGRAAIRDNSCGLQESGDAWPVSQESCISKSCLRHPSQAGRAVGGGFPTWEGVLGYGQGPGAWLRAQGVCAAG